MLREAVAETEHSEEAEIFPDLVHAYKTQVRAKSRIITENLQ